MDRKVSNGNNLQPIFDLQTCRVNHLTNLVVLIMMLGRTTSRSLRRLILITLTDQENVYSGVN